MPAAARRARSSSPSTSAAIASAYHAGGEAPSSPTCPRTEAASARAAPPAVARALSGGLVAGDDERLEHSDEPAKAARRRELPRRAIAVRRSAQALGRRRVVAVEQRPVRLALEADRVHERVVVLALGHRHRAPTLSPRHTRRDGPR